nr:hypothetical protein Ade03nite_60870 [Actinoplanes derwentensis]
MITNRSHTSPIGPTPPEPPLGHASTDYTTVLAPRKASHDNVRTSPRTSSTGTTAHRNLSGRHQRSTRRRRGHRLHPDHGRNHQHGRRLCPATKYSPRLGLRLDPAFADCPRLSQLHSDLDGEHRSDRQ